MNTNIFTGKAVKDTNNFTTLSELITHLSGLPGIVGIVEYGGRTYTDMTYGGDYDLTVIFEKPPSTNFSGVHFHVAGIPVDCMLLSIADFTALKPATPFHVVHLEGTILYDKDGITAKLLKEIEPIWKKPQVVTESQVAWIRFVCRHILDKLEYRLYDDFMFSKYSLEIVFMYTLETYVQLKGLGEGQPKAWFSYMEEYDERLYAWFRAAYSTSDLKGQFASAKEISEYVAKDVGGMWGEDEALFHLLPEGRFDREEQESFVEILFHKKGDFNRKNTCS